jgi:hypothetical protein
MSGRRYMNFLRKNAKPVMVFMGIVCMITFVIAGALTNLAENARRRAVEQERNPIVVTWAKGKVRIDEIATLRRKHQLAWDFLFTVLSAAVDRGGRPIINGHPFTTNQQFIDVGIPMDNTEETAMQTMVLAEEARRLGIVVDQAAVKDFLRQVSSPELRDGDWVEIASSILARANANLSVGQLIDHVGYELKAQHVRNLALAGLYAHGVGPIVPPGEAFDLFNRINRRFSIEAFPIDVQPLAKDVRGEPPAAEIQKLFDEGRFRDPNPNIDEPGFHKPHKLAFTYLKVSFTPFLEEAKKQITEEQIEEAYKKDIEQGQHKVQDLPSTTPPEKSDAEKKEGEQPAAEKPSDKHPPATEDKSATEKPADKPPESKPNGDKGGCEASDDPPAQKTDAEKPAAEKPVTAPAAEDKKEAQAADEKPAEQKEDAAKPAETQPPAKEPKFKPLSEVHDQILTRLAQPIAEEARKKATGEVVAAIEKYGKAYRRYVDARNVGKNPDLKEPEKLDLAPLAVKYNFPIGETPLVDQYEIADYEIGQKVQQLDFAALQQRRQIHMLSFADIAFSQDDPLYKPEEARSSEPDVNYIYFRTAEQKAADVTLKEARPQVIEFWKKRQAFELALSEAQRLADKAKSAMSLAEVVPDATKIVTTPPFAWMTPGSFGMSGPELSPVPGIELAGQEFMQGVFSLQPGQSGVAPNQPHSKVYLVRVLAQDPDDEKLQTQFLESGYNELVVTLGRNDAWRTAVDCIRGIEDQYHVKWQRPPDERRRM